MNQALVWYHKPWRSICTHIQRTQIASRHHRFHYELKNFSSEKLSCFFIFQNSFLAAFSYLGRLFKNIYRNELLTDLDNVPLREMLKVHSIALATALKKLFWQLWFLKLHYKNHKETKWGESRFTEICLFY